MAGATGAIIVREDGVRAHWKKKCDVCGFVDPSTNVSTKPSPGSWLAAGYFQCFKCQHQSEVCIYG